MSHGSDNFALVLAGGLLATAACFAACTGSSNTVQIPAATQSATAAPAPLPTMSGAPSAVVTQLVQPPPRSLSECAAPRSQISSFPDGGVIFNNAMTSADAGFIDRTAGVLEALMAERNGFACCLDHAGRDEVATALVVTIQPSGAIEEAHLADPNSVAEEAAACLVEVATRVVFPASPTDKPTVVKLPLRAKRPPNNG